MLPHGNIDVPWDVLSVGATRPAVIRAIGVPFWFILPIVGVPAVLVLATNNPFWMLLAIVLTALGRWFVAADHNRPRIIFLSIMSGSMFCNRSRHGCDTTDPLGAAVHEG